jgi:hypothetical protein
METKRQTPEQMVRAALRLQRGIALLDDPDYKVEQFVACPGTFYVEKTNGDNYIVSVPKVTCTCPDFLQTQEPCKHYYACEEEMSREAQVARCDELAALAANAEDAEWGCSPL